MKCPRCGFNEDPVNEPEYGDLCSNCEEDEREAERDYDYSGNEDLACIGPECVNPHPFHTYSECETVEMHEAYEQSLDEIDR